MRSVSFALALGVSLFAARADASALSTFVGVDMSEVFCGLNHKSPQEPSTPTQTAEGVSPVFIGPVLQAKPSGSAVMKCHLASHRRVSAVDDAACFHMRHCDPASPDGAPGVFFTWDLAPAAAHVDGHEDSSAKFTAKTTAPLIQPDSPEPRPPASTTV